MAPSQGGRNRCVLERYEEIGCCRMSELDSGGPSNGNQSRMRRAGMMACYPYWMDVHSHRTPAEQAVWHPDVHNSAGPLVECTQMVHPRPLPGLR